MGFILSKFQRTGVIRFNDSEKQILIKSVRTIKSVVIDLENTVFADFFIRVLNDTVDKKIALEVKNYCQKRVGDRLRVTLNDSPEILSMKLIVIILDGRLG